MSRRALSPIIATACALLASSVACRGGSCMRDQADPASASVSWASSGYSIAEADIGGGASRDLIGLCTEEGDSALLVCAFDGHTFDLRWRSTSIGDASTAYLVQIGVASRRVAAVDALGVIHVLDLASGKQLGSAKLSDRAESVCAPRDSPGKVWIRALDKTESLFDVTSMALVRAPRPVSCPAPALSMADAAICTSLPPDTVTMPQCKGHEAPPAIPGFIGTEVTVDGADGIVTGMKNPGSAVPMIAGFTPGAAGKPPVLRWQHGVAPGNALNATVASPTPPGLAGGRAVVTYDDLEGAHHVEAIDAATGKVLWDQPTDGFLKLRVTATRVYVMRWSRLDVRDARTGALLGGVGTR